MAYIAPDVLINTLIDTRNFLNTTGDQYRHKNKYIRTINDMVETIILQLQGEEDDNYTCMFYFNYINTRHPSFSLMMAWPGIDDTRHDVWYSTSMSRYE